MKKSVKIIAAAAIAVFVILALVYVVHSRMGEDIEAGNPSAAPPETKPTEGADITQGVTGTLTLEPSKKPSVTPEAGPTDTPIPVPTDMPEATQTPEPMPSPTPTNTPVPSQTPTPEPTPTMAVTPTPAVEIPVERETYTRKENGKEITYHMAKIIQIADDWVFIIYENSKITLYNMATGMAIGHDRYIGNPDILKMDTTELIGLTVLVYKDSKDTDRVAIYNSIYPSLLPTPTPTPFPTPNPEQPKMFASYKGDKEYGDITVEAWDNGYLYVKGTGVLRKNFSMSYTPQDLKDYWAFDRGVKVTHVIVEEGVTELRDFPYWASNSYDKRESIIYLEFPSTLTGVSFESFDIHFLHDVEIVGYKDGERITYLLETDGKKLSDKESLYDVMRKNFNVHSVGYSD